MNRRPKKLIGPSLVSQSAPGIEWRDYERIEPGTYPAYCRWAKHYRDPGFKRWTCLIRFDVLSGNLMEVRARVPFWINLGARAKPHAGRRGKYLKEWARANGGPPTRRDRLSPNVFTGRMAFIEIGDTKGDAPYSVVRKIVSWETGAAGVTQSSSHTVKEGRVKGMRTNGLWGMIVKRICFGVARGCGGLAPEAPRHIVRSIEGGVMV
jgi:hypothetical protein